MGQLSIWLMIKSVASQTDQNIVHSLLNQLKLDIHAMKRSQVTHIHQLQKLYTIHMPWPHRDSLPSQHDTLTFLTTQHYHTWRPTQNTWQPIITHIHTQWHDQTAIVIHQSSHNTDLTQNSQHTTHHIARSSHKPVLSSHKPVLKQHCPLTSAWGSAPRAQWIPTWRACSSARQTWGDAGGGNPAGHGASSPGPPWRCRQTHPENPAGHWQKSRHKGTVSNEKQEGQMLKQPTSKTNQPQVNKLHMRIMKLLFKLRLHNQSNTHTHTRMRKTQRADMNKHVISEHWKCHPS